MKVTNISINATGHGRDGEVLPSDVVITLEDGTSYTVPTLMPTGLAGKRGSVWSYGKGFPRTTDTTYTGDMYFNTDNNGLYSYTQDGWVIIGTFYSPKGDTGTGITNVTSKTKEGNSTGNNVATLTFHKTDNTSNDVDVVIPPGPQGANGGPDPYSPGNEVNFSFSENRQIGANQIVTKDIPYGLVFKTPPYVKVVVTPSFPSEQYGNYTDNWSGEVISYETVGPSSVFDGSDLEWVSRTQFCYKDRSQWDSVGYCQYFIRGIIDPTKTAEKQASLNIKPPERLKDLSLNSLVIDQSTPTPGQNSLATITSELSNGQKVGAKFTIPCGPKGDTGPKGPTGLGISSVNSFRNPTSEKLTFVFEDGSLADVEFPIYDGHSVSDLGFNQISSNTLMVSPILDNGKQLSASSITLPQGPQGVSLKKITVNQNGQNASVSYSLSDGTTADAGTLNLNVPYVTSIDSSYDPDKPDGNHWIFTPKMSNGTTLTPMKWDATPLVSQVSNYFTNTKNQVDAIKNDVSKHFFQGINFNQVDKSSITLSASLADGTTMTSNTLTLPQGPTGVGIKNLYLEQDQNIPTKVTLHSVLQDGSDINTGSVELQTVQGPQGSKITNISSSQEGNNVKIKFSFNDSADKEMDFRVVSESAVTQLAMEQDGNSLILTPINSSHDRLDSYTVNLPKGDTGPKGSDGKSITDFKLIKNDNINGAFDASVTYSDGSVQNAGTITSGKYAQSVVYTKDNSSNPDPDKIFSQILYSDNTLSTPLKFPTRKIITYNKEKMVNDHPSLYQDRYSGYTSLSVIRQNSDFPESYDDSKLVLYLDSPKVLDKRFKFETPNITGTSGTISIDVLDTDNQGNPWPDPSVVHLRVNTPDIPTLGQVSSSVIQSLNKEFDQINQEFSQYLPLTGGTITGSLTSSYSYSYKLDYNNLYSQNTTQQNNYLTNKYAAIQTLFTTTYNSTQLFKNMLLTENTISRNLFSQNLNISNAYQNNTVNNTSTYPTGHGKISVSNNSNDPNNPDFYISINGEYDNTTMYSPGNTNGISTDPVSTATSHNWNFRVKDGSLVFSNGASIVPTKTGLSFTDSSGTVIGNITANSPMGNSSGQTTCTISTLPAPTSVGQTIFVTDAPKLGEGDSNDDGSLKSTSRGTGAMCVYDGINWFNIAVNQYVDSYIGANTALWNLLKNSTSQYTSYLGDPTPNENFNSTVGPQSGAMLTIGNEVKGNFPAPIKGGWFVMEFSQGFNTGVYGGYSIVSNTGPLLALITDNNQSVTISQLTGQHDCYGMPNGQTYYSWSGTNSNGVYGSWTRKAIFNIYTRNNTLTFDMYITDDSGNILLQQLGYQVPGATAVIGYDIGSIGNDGTGGQNATTKTVFIMKQTSVNPITIPYTQLLGVN